MRRLAWNLLFCTYSPQSSCQNNHPLTPILWLPGSVQVPWFFKDHAYCIGDDWVSNSGSFPTLLFSSLLLVCETKSFPGRTSIYVFANYTLHNYSFIKCSWSYSATLKLTLGAYAVFQVKNSKVQKYCSGRSRVEISVLVARSQYGIRNWVNHHMTAFDVFTSHQFTANWSVFMAMLGFHWAGP